MKKYFQTARTTWENSFVYRLNFVMWRARQILSLITGYFLWLALFSNKNQLFGYGLNEMLTYVLSASAVQSLVFSSRTIDLAAVINSGELSRILVKPLSNIKYWFAQDLADKALNIIFSVGEIGLLIWWLRPNLAIPSWSGIIIFLILLPGALILYFLINYLFGLLGFWTPEVWAPRFLLLVFLMFAAGNMFPLDVLPGSIVKVISLTPFPYLIYYPVRALLGKLAITDTGLIIAMTYTWIGIMYLIVKLMWEKGLKAYGAEGN